MKHNTIKQIRQSIKADKTNTFAQWVGGRLLIDGIDTHRLVAFGETRGLVKRSREHFPQDGKPVTKRRHPRPSLISKRAEALAARLAAGIETKTHKMLRLRKERAAALEAQKGQKA